MHTHLDSDRDHDVVGGDDRREGVNIGVTASAHRAGQQPGHNRIAHYSGLHGPPNGGPVLDVIDVRHVALSLFDAALRN